MRQTFDHMIKNYFAIYLIRLQFYIIKTHEDKLESFDEISFRSLAFARVSALVI